MTDAPAPAEFLPDADGNARVVLHGGDSRELVKGLPPGSIDAVVCDPPYALVSIVKRFGKKGSAPAKGNEAYVRASAGFMGKQWDTGEVAFDPAFWVDVMAAMKPGAHLVAFSGTRSYHRLACAIEDAGFEIRDSILDMIASDDPVLRFLNSLSEEQAEAFLRCIDESTFGGMLAWVYGSGFPKSHDVAKAIDKAAGHWRGRAGAVVIDEQVAKGREYERTDKGEAITAAAAAWQGWGTALKPAWEPIVLARKPLDGTVAGNVLKHGTGALNIDGCRIGEAGGTRKAPSDDKSCTDSVGGFLNAQAGESVEGLGRWPANIVHDGSDEVIDQFPAEAGGGNGEARVAFGIGGNGAYGGGGAGALVESYADSGSAARFFYTAKADAEDRLGSKHPTVKPVDLMQWLVRLICPKGGTLLDPFAGTGTTGEAAWREGCRAVLFEREAEYRADIARRMEMVLASPRMRKAEIAARRGLRGGTGTVIIDEIGGLFGPDVLPVIGDQGGATGLRDVPAGPAE